MRSILPQKAVFLSTLAALFALPASAGAQTDDLLVVEKRKDLSARNKLLRHLRSIRVDCNFEDAGAKEVIEFLRYASGKGVHFLLASKNLKADDWPKVTLQMRKIPVTGLMAAYEQKSKLKFTYRAGMVFLRPADEVKAFTYLRMYDVRTAVMPVRNFVPRYRFGLKGSGEENVVVEEEEAKPLICDADRLIDLIKDNCVKDSWDADGTSIESLRGLLMVRQTVKGHQAVQDLLVKLGAIPAPRRVVVKRPRPVRPAKRKTTKKKPAAKKRSLR